MIVKTLLCNSKLYKDGFTNFINNKKRVERGYRTTTKFKKEFLIF